MVLFSDPRPSAADVFEVCSRVNRRPWRSAKVAFMLACYFRGCLAGVLSMICLLEPVPVLGGPARSARPNIVYILADDLGYGDVRCFNPEGKIPTPNIDHLAAQGI